MSRFEHVPNRRALIDRRAIADRLAALDGSDTAALGEAFPKFLQRGSVDGLMCEFVRKDGGRRLVMLNGLVSRGQDGRFLRTHCIMTDLTERHLQGWPTQQADDPMALKASRERALALGAKD